MSEYATKSTPPPYFGHHSRGAVRVDGHVAVHRHAVAATAAARRIGGAPHRPERKRHPPQPLGPGLRADVYARALASRMRAPPPRHMQSSLVSRNRNRTRNESLLRQRKQQVSPAAARLPRRRRASSTWMGPGTSGTTTTSATMAAKAPGSPTTGTSSHGP